MLKALFIGEHTGLLVEVNTAIRNFAPEKKVQSLTILLSRKACGRDRALEKGIMSQEPGDEQAQAQTKADLKELLEKDPRPRERYSCGSAQDVSGFIGGMQESSAADSGEEALL
eukprot:GSA25T00016107001.1